MRDSRKELVEGAQRALGAISRDEDERIRRGLIKALRATLALYGGEELLQCKAALRSFLEPYVRRRAQGTEGDTGPAKGQEKRAS